MFAEDALYLLGANANPDLEVMMQDTNTKHTTDSACQEPQQSVSGMGNVFRSTHFASLNSFAGSPSALARDQQVANIAPTATAHPASGEERLKCPRGCTGTFGRSGEYRRHMQKHGG
ncbi:hypothetical protein GQ44DRAFT_706803 [Phaeosphaeriaceae sp. PMI808]|nr:hypothetical protein GQ44DRAFT_706803 [Phaeosphaeriaceae sp. PMI808]